jgi:hypothetical protein
VSEITSSAIQVGSSGTKRWRIPHRDDAAVLHCRAAESASIIAASVSRFAEATTTLRAYPAHITAIFVMVFCQFIVLLVFGRSS